LATPHRSATCPWRRSAASRAAGDCTTLRRADRPSAGRHGAPVATTPSGDRDRAACRSVASRPAPRRPPTDGM